jgi:hypothetical protein
MAGLGHLLHCLELLAASVRDQRGARSIEPTSVLQLVLRVESKEVGCALSIIGARDLLRLIDHVREGKAVLGGEQLHLFE